MHDGIRIPDGADPLRSIKPTKSEFLKSAYELTPTSLELAAQHPNVVRRGGKAGREAEYTYTFGVYPG